MVGVGDHRRPRGRRHRRDHHRADSRTPWAQSLAVALDQFSHALNIDTLIHPDEWWRQADSARSPAVDAAEPAQCASADNGASGAN